MELIKVELNTTVENSLFQAKFELLPEEMADNSLTKWVTNFDQLRQRDRQERRFYDQERPNDGDMLDLIVAPIIQNALTPTVSFYFASLFHIGRQWQVAQYASETATDALRDENLERTAELDLQSFQDDFDRLGVAPNERRNFLLDSLRDVLSYSEQQHSQRIKMARRLWEVWKSEVEELRGVVEKLSPNFDELKYYERERRRHYPSHYDESNRAFMRSLYRLIFFSVEQRRLYHLLHRDGVKFKNITDSRQAPAALAQLLPLVLMAGREDAFVGDVRECFSMYYDILRRQESLIEQERLAPLIQQVEAQLLKLFERENPFKNYQILKSPPDSELRSLWNECKLPNNEMFHYAQNWLDSLEEEPEFDYKALPYKTPLNEEDVISYSRSADSTIKRGWVEGSKDDPIIVDKDLIQRFFEIWVEALAAGALFPTIKEKGTQEWDADSLHDLIRRVVNYLNTLGYTLTAPSIDRLSVLWKELSKKDRSYWQSIDW